jgi:hypothetical protein
VRRANNRVDTLSLPYTGSIARKIKEAQPLWDVLKGMEVWFSLPPTLAGSLFFFRPPPPPLSALISC